MRKIRMRRNTIPGSRKPDLSKTEEKMDIFRVLAVSPLSGCITKGTSLCKGLKNPGLGLNLHNHKPQSEKRNLKTYRRLKE